MEQNNFVYFNAYWISPMNKVIGVPISHIDTAMNDLETFGLSEEYIKQEYDRTGEKFRSEGIARENIILRLMEEGWIRIRNYRQFWSMTLNELDMVSASYIYDWCDHMVNKLGVGMYSEIRISTIHNTIIVEMSDVLKNNKLGEFFNIKRTSEKENDEEGIESAQSSDKYLKDYIEYETETDTDFEDFVRSLKKREYKYKWASECKNVSNVGYSDLLLIERKYFDKLKNIK
jgi:hypothetical protein